MKHLSAILGLSILLTVGLACGDADNSANGNKTATQSPETKNADNKTTVKNDSTADVSVEWVKLYTDDGSGDRGDEVTNFKPTDNPQHFTARLSEFESGTKIKAVFTAINAGGEKNFKILEKEIETNSITNQGDFTLKMPNPFPVGDYKADFYINGKLSKTVNYKVQ